MDVMTNWNHVCKIAVVLLDTEWIIRKCLFLSSPLITNTVTGLGVDSCRECNMEEIMLDLKFRGSEFSYHPYHSLSVKLRHSLYVVYKIHNNNLPTFPMGLLWASNDLRREMLCECEGAIILVLKATCDPDRHFYLGKRVNHAFGVFFSIFRPRVLVLAQETQLLPWNTIYHLLLLTNSKTLERLSSLCINSLLLRNKVSPNWVASNNAYLLSHSFWEPGMMPDIDIWRLDWDWGMRFQDGAWTWLLAGGFWSHHTALSPWDGS